MTHVADELMPNVAIAAPPAVLEGAGFRAVVEAYGQRLFSLAYRMTGNVQDAEDLVQESFLRAYRSRAQFQERSSLATWLYRICTNAALDHLRRRRCQPQPLAADPDDAGDATERLPSAAPSPERLLLSREVGHRVTAALATLSAKERAAFILRHYEQLTIEEISAVLGLRTAATKNTIFRGVRKLRRALEDV